VFEYHHLAPVILTDAMFFDYVPTCSHSGSAAQRRAAYVIAEQQMMEHLQTFLVPTSVTGTFLWNSMTSLYRLPYDYVRAIPRVVVTSLDSLCSCDLTENEACALIRDEWGLIDILQTSNAYASHCGCAPGCSYLAIVTVTAGLNTGTAALDTSLHLALSMAASVALNEIVDPGANEGGPGDPGIQSYGSLGHSETRIPLQPTAFGQTPIGNYVARLVRHLKHRRPLKF